VKEIYYEKKEAFKSRSVSAVIISERSIANKVERNLHILLLMT
jgi:hypothetical protein